MLAGPADAARGPLPASRNHPTSHAQASRAAGGRVLRLKKISAESVPDCRRGANRTDRLHSILGSRRSTAGHSSFHFRRVPLVQRGYPE
jgi:hypothetical protein